MWENVNIKYNNTNTIIIYNNNTTMKIVTKVINLIKSGNKALMHRKQKGCSQDINADYED